MKLSTKGRYGLKAVVDLAVNYGKGPMTLPSLAVSQGVSEAYLERLLRMLKNDGIVETLRGAQGGYTLAVSPDALTVERVLTVLEGSTSIVDCVGTVGTAGCKNACTCSARPLFLTLQNKIDSVLNDTSIRDLAEDYLEQKRRLTHAKSLS